MQHTVYSYTNRSTLWEGGWAEIFPPTTLSYVLKRQGLLYLDTRKAKCFPSMGPKPIFQRTYKSCCQWPDEFASEVTVSPVKRACRWCYCFPIGGRMGGVALGATHPHHIWSVWPHLRLVHMTWPNSTFYSKTHDLTMTCEPSHKLLSIISPLKCYAAISYPHLHTVCETYLLSLGRETVMDSSGLWNHRHTTLYGVLYTLSKAKCRMRICRTRKCWVAQNENAQGTYGQQR